MCYYGSSLTILNLFQVQVYFPVELGEIVLHLLALYCECSACYCCGGLFSGYFGIINISFKRMGPRTFSTGHYLGTMLKHNRLSGELEIM